MRGAWVMLIVVALLMAASCAPVPAESDEQSDSPSEETPAEEVPPVQVEPGAPPGETDFTYLNGSWAVSAELTDIDEGAMRESAEQPRQRWQFTVDGTSMTLATDTHTYTGTIAPELDEGWVFTAIAQLEDEDGHPWTSAVEIHGKPTGEATFSGSMEQSVDSSADGHRYSAQYRIEGRRQ